MNECPYCEGGFFQEEDPGFRKLVGKVRCRECEAADREEIADGKRDDAMAEQIERCKEK